MILYIFCNLFIALHQILNIIFATQEYRTALVDGLGGNVKNPFRPRRSDAPSLVLTFSSSSS